MTADGPQSRIALQSKTDIQLSIFLTVQEDAIPVEKVLDTTGAGDYFAAGFLYGLTCGYSLEKCAKIGSILSGNVIQVIGTTISPERWDEIKLNINKVLAE